MEDIEANKFFLLIKSIWPFAIFISKSSSLKLICPLIMMIFDSWSDLHNKTLVNKTGTSISIPSSKLKNMKNLLQSFILLLPKCNVTKETMEFIKVRISKILHKKVKISLNRNLSTFSVSSIWEAKMFPLSMVKSMIKSKFKRFSLKIKIWTSFFKSIIKVKMTQVFQLNQKQLRILKNISVDSVKYLTFFQR